MIVSRCESDTTLQIVMAPLFLTGKRQFFYHKGTKTPGFVQQTPEIIVPLRLGGKSSRRKRESHVNLGSSFNL
jgi:hypothetical protein